MNVRPTVSSASDRPRFAADACLARLGQLGRRLSGFGGDEAARQLIDRACRANAWFTPADIRRAVQAIVSQLLQPEALASWLAGYPRVPSASLAASDGAVRAARRVRIVMAGNIPLVGFFDLLCVVASGHRAVVKPSAKDRPLMEWMAAELAALGFDVVTDDGRSDADAVIATGSDTAMRHFRMRYAGMPMLLRGHRQSAAVLSGEETPAQLAGLCDDIWAYSGLGCRSVAMLWLPEGYTPALTMPQMTQKYRNNYRQERALLEMTGQPFVDWGGAVGVAQREFPATLSRIACARYRTLAEVEAWLAAHDGELQCVVSSCVNHARRVDFGRAQLPGLTDYPDARDVMAFLEEL